MKRFIRAFVVAVMFVMMLVVALVAYAVETGTLGSIMQPQTGELITDLFKFLGATLVGLGLWLVRWLTVKARGNAVAEALLNLALGWLHKKAEEPDTQIVITDWLKKHKPSWVTDADINAGMRGAMKKAEIIVASPGTTLPK